MTTLSEVASEAWGDAFAVACAVADTAIEHTTGFNLEVGGHISNLVQTGAGYKEALEHDAGGKGCNPYFLTHKVDELDVPNHSRKTQRYFKYRRLKKLGGAAFSGVGAALSPLTQINTLGVARHGRASASSWAHWYRLRALAKQVKSSSFLTHLVDVLINAKFIKARSRTGQMIGDAIPGGVPGGSIIGAVIGGASSVAGTLLLKKRTAAVTLAAIELHWRAYQEVSLARVFGGSGPATRMLQELMNSPVLDKVHTGTPLETYIREPMGYLVFRDKLLLL